MNKKAIVNPFDIASRFGYYILALMIISVLFLFFAVLIQGSQTTYYKNSFGTEVISLEDLLFKEISYRDYHTDQLYSKVLDAETLRYYRTPEGATALNQLLGIYSDTAPNAIKYDIYYKTSTAPLNLGFESRNFPNEPDFVKIFPVLIKDTTSETIGYIEISFGRVE